MITRLVPYQERGKAANLAAHYSDPTKVHTTNSALSAALIAVIGEHLPNARLTLDRYHLAASSLSPGGKLSEVIDAVSAAEIASRPDLKRTRSLWLRSWPNLTTRQRRELEQLMRTSAQLATARALRWWEEFPVLYDQDPSYPADYPALLVRQRLALAPATD